MATSLALIGSQLNMPFLGAPYALLIFSVFSALTVGIFSIRAAVYYVSLHMRYGHKRGYTYRKAEEYSLSFPKIRKMLATSAVSVVSMTYLVVSSLPFLDYETGLGFISISLLFLAFVIMAPALHVSGWILRKASLVYENPVDGTRMNLGTDLSNKLTWAIGPLALVRLIHLEVTNFPNIGFGITLLAFTIVVAIPSLALTYFLLKVRLPALALKLEKELDKLLQKSSENVSSEKSQERPKG